jgi:uncharacterized membrane protein
MSVKIAGHPVHPMLIVFPLGLLATAAVFDAIGLIRNSNHWFTISFYMIAAGILGGLLAAIFGFLDFLSIPRRTRAWFIGLWHGLGNLLVVVLFAGSWALRRNDVSNPPAIAFVLSYAGVLLALVTGWLGGELVDRLGIGVDAGAHPNSPSSLSGRPASEDAGTRAPRRVA